MQQDNQLNNERYRIEFITGKEWKWVLANYSLPELIRLQGAMLFFATV